MYLKKKEITRTEKYERGIVAKEKAKEVFYMHVFLKSIKNYSSFLLLLVKFRFKK